RLLTTGGVEPDLQWLLNQVDEKSWGQFRTSIEQTNYLVSYRSTSLLPIVLVLLSDEALALAAWRHDEAMIHIFLLVVSIITVLVALAIAVIQEKRWLAQGDIQLLSSAIRSTASAVFITNKQGEIHWINNAFSQLTGYSFAEVKGKTPRILKSNYHSQTFYKELWATILSGDNWRGELTNRHKQGHTLIVEQTITPILDEHNNIEHFIAVHEDVTARKTAEEKAQYLANHDSLTGLPNRRFFEQHLQQIFAYSAPDTQHAVLLIDLDRFKDINDSMGHQAGDALLVHTTANLQELMDENYLLARLGGDESDTLVRKVENQKHMAALTRQVIMAVTKTYHYEDGVINITCSAGIATDNSRST